MNPAIDFADLFFCSVEGKLSWIYKMMKLSDLN